MGNARDNRKLMSEIGHSTDDPEAHQGKRGGTATHFFSATITNPDIVQGVVDAVSILPVESGWAVNGITLLKVGIKVRPTTAAGSDYVVNFEEWTTPTDPAPSTIATVTVVTATQAETASLTDASIAAGSIIKVDLPATDADELVVWGEFTID